MTMVKMRLLKPALLPMCERPKNSNLSDLSDIFDFLLDI